MASSWKSLVVRYSVALLLLAPYVEPDNVIWECLDLPTPDHFNWKKLANRVWLEVKTQFTGGSAMSHCFFRKFYPDQGKVSAGSIDSFGYVQRRDPNSGRFERDRFRYTSDKLQPDKSYYQVIDTDYSTWVLMYDCLDGHSSHFHLYTSTPMTVSKELRKKAAKAIAATGYRSLIPLFDTGCQKLVNLTPEAKKVIGDVLERLSIVVEVI
ncbi:uncharacterized protein LOC144104662 [Amblyomma americanum]